MLLSETCPVSFFFIKYFSKIVLILYIQKFRSAPRLSLLLTSRLAICAPQCNFQYLPAPPLRGISQLIYSILQFPTLHPFLNGVPTNACHPGQSALHTPHHSFSFTMAADEWLLELDRNAEASLRAREEARRRQDAQEEAEAISEGDESRVSCTDSSDEMSVVIDDDRPLAEYGPSIEELEEFTRDQALKLGATSTAKQYGRKMEEYRDFAGAVFNDEAVTVDRAIKFLQFQAHRECRNTGDDPPELTAEALSASKTKKRKRRVKKGNGTKVSKYKFNVDDYKKVMDTKDENALAFALF